MWQTIKKERGAQILLIIFGFFTLWWFFLHLFVDPEDLLNQIFSALYGTVALVGGIYGFHTAKKWGGSKSLLGRAMIMFSLGLFAQEFGQLVYSFYVFFLNIDIPYPSIGDVGYFGSIPLYVYGVYLLAKVSGVKIDSKSLSSVLKAVLIPFIMLCVGYFLFLRGYKFDASAPITIFLDFGYPLGEAIYVSIAILIYVLSRKILGGVMRDKVLFIIFALSVQFLADYTFLYLAHYSTVLPGGVNDYMYLLSYFLMGLGLIQLKTVYDVLRVKK